MPEQTITVEAHTLEEARELTQGQIPRGLSVLAGQLDTEGTVSAIRATAATDEGALALALQSVPADMRVIAQEVLTPAERKRMPVEARSEGKARATVQKRLSRTQLLEGLEVLEPGKKGVLGIGGQATMYEAVVLQQAVVEVRYQARSTFAFTVGPQREYRLLKTWGGYGLRCGQFYAPAGIAVDWRGDVYVTDNGLILNEALPGGERYSRVVKYDRDGKWLGQWGEHGAGEGQLLEAQGIAIDARGYVLVADGAAGHICSYDPRGRRVATWGSKGSGEGQFSGGTLHLALAPDESIYVSDRSAHRILHFRAGGAFLSACGSNGSGEGQFERPEGLAVDARGYVYITDGGNDRVQVFDSQGQFIRLWGGRGLAPGQFQVPRGIAVDAVGCIYVCSAGIPVQKFSGEGEFIAQWQIQPPRRGRPAAERPDDLALDSTGAVYVLDGHNKQVLKFG